MSENFPSIWLELKDHLGAKTIIGGFYIEWSREGKNSDQDQVKRIDILLEQFDLATEKCKRVIGNSKG